MATTGQAEPKLTVAEILRCGAAEYIKRHPSQAAPQVQSTLAKLSLCRTAALKGRKYRCGTCPHECIVYNSCGDRHCPQCSGAKRSDWIDSSSLLILEGVDYYQVVFTLPSELSRLSLGNRKPIYDLLFRSAYAALKQTIESEQGYDPAALMVLHTWNQKLDAHAHVHAIVPGGGPALDGSGWKVSLRDGDLESVGQYLVDKEALRSVYRDKFLSGLQRLWKSGKLKLSGEFAPLQSEQAFKDFIDSLGSVTWVSYIEPPPTADCSPTHVLKYLGRYLTGGPISDRRIVSADEGQVTFLAREGTKRGGESKQVPITLSSVEFTRRWSLHVLPMGYTKSRRFGGWSNTRRDAYQEQCCQQLDTADAWLSDQASEFGPFEVVADADVASEACCPTCPRCQTPMILHSVCDKPRWHEVMHSASRPAWYRIAGSD